MTHFCGHAIWLLLVIVAMGAAKAPPTTAPAAAPKQEEILKTFEAKDYTATLQQITRVLPLKGPAAAGYDRHELLMLKGESHLQLKQLKSASDAFGAASKETDDNVKAATARSMQLLLKQSKNFKVQRRVARKDTKMQAVDLLDFERRPDAFRIAYEDVFAEFEPKMKAILKSRLVPELTAAVDAFREVHDLELAATGGDAEYLMFRRQIVDRVVSLVVKELANVEQDVIEIRKRADEIVHEKITYRSSVSDAANDQNVNRNVERNRDLNQDEEQRRLIRRGLSNKDRIDLKEAIATCNAAMKTTKALAKTVDLEPATVDDIADRARQTARDADRALAARY